MYKFSLFSIDTLRLLKNVCFQEPKDPFQDLIDDLGELIEDDLSIRLQGQSTLPHDTSCDWVDISSEICGPSNDERRPERDEPEESLPETVSSSSSIDTPCPETTLSNDIEGVNMEITTKIIPKDQVSSSKSDRDDDIPVDRPIASELILQEDVKIFGNSGHGHDITSSPTNEIYAPKMTKNIGSSSIGSNESSGISDSHVAGTSSSMSSSNGSPERIISSINNDHQYCCYNDPIKKKRISNRLDLTGIIVRPALVVVVEEKGWKQSGIRSKKIFDSIYETLGKNSHKIIEVRVEQNYLKIYTENDDDRLILMKELKDMNQFVKETSPYQLYIQNPLKPSIQFLCCAETYKMPSCDLIALIRRENSWSPEWTVNIESKEWIRKLRKAKLSLIIDSRIRDKIDTEEGIIYVAGKETKIFDKFGITQCSVCLRLGHSKCRSRIRCFFCSGFHSDKFRHDKYSEKKFCFLCWVEGHAPISKNCPTLVAEIRSKLELIDHKYKDIFIGTDRSY